MIQIIPSSTQSIVTTTPLHARTLKRLWFENKNGGLSLDDNFDYFISIQVDGAYIVNELSPFFFMPELPQLSANFNNKTFPPYDNSHCSLELNIPVHQSEVVISFARQSNDFNIVLEYSELPPPQAGSTNEFAETFILGLRGTATRPTSYSSRIIVPDESGSTTFFDLEREPDRVAFFPFFLLGGKINHLPYLEKFQYRFGNANQYIAEHFDLSLLSLSHSNALKDAAYAFDQPIGKSVPLTLTYPQSINTGLMSIKDFGLAICFLSKNHKNG